MAVVVCLLVVAAFAFAQDTREAEIAAQQREKAVSLAPHRPHSAEELLLQARQTLVEQPSGFYPGSFQSVYSGGGFTLGEGYRHYTGDRTHWSIAGLYSIKGYKLDRSVGGVARPLGRAARSARGCRLA